MSSGGTTRNVLRRIVRHYSPLIRARGRTIRHFAHQVGFVYFGAVDQRHDDHDVIRGLTVSTTHQDTHFSIGSFNNYDVSLVDRFDVVMNDSGRATEHAWLILQVALQGPSLPHLFFKPLGHSPAAYNRFFVAYNNLHVVSDLFDEAHSSEFRGRYEVYGIASRSQEIERMFTPDITRTIAARFWPHAIEILDGKLYVYTTEHRPTGAMLGAALEASTWLAETIDKRQV